MPHHFFLSCFNKQAACTQLSAIRNIQKAKVSLNPILNSAFENDNRWIFARPYHSSAQTKSTDSESDGSELSGFTILNATEVGQFISADLLPTVALEATGNIDVAASSNSDVSLVLKRTKRHGSSDESLLPKALRIVSVLGVSS